MSILKAVGVFEGLGVRLSVRLSQPALVATFSKPIGIADIKIVSPHKKAIPKKDSRQKVQKVTSAKPIASLKKLIEAKELSVQFRNLDKLTEEEIKEIIKGKNLVDLMDELDGETD